MKFLFKDPTGFGFLVVYNHIAKNNIILEYENLSLLFSGLLLNLDDMEEKENLKNIFLKLFENTEYFKKKIITL